MDKEHLEKLCQFADEVIAHRLALGMSQSDMAIQAKMSMRGLQNIEQKKFKFVPRAKTIIQIASALRQNAMKWLAMLGYDEITEEKVSEIGKKIGISIPDRIEAVEYFESLLTKTKGTKALLCITVLSRIGFTLSHGPRIQSLLSKLLDQENVCIAFIIPCPQNTDIKTTSKTDLINYYQAIYNDVIGFVKEILVKKNEDTRNRMGVFYPNALNNFFVSPHISHSYVRSTLLQLTSGSEDTTVKKFELGAWGTTRHNNKDGWIRMYPDPEGMAPLEAEDLLRYWRSYLQEIIEKWYPSLKGDDFGFWHKETIPI